ncbi:MAG TPA: IS200/IS605 family transposase [Planctomycetes bacterium]|nr:IS200/IS605 family transposase [Planctomycetota bacterium]
MDKFRHGSHTVSGLSVHLVWITKYRYKVLIGDLKMRCRSVLIQGCDAMDVRILKGVVSGDHVHMHVEYPPALSVSDLVKRLKGRSSRLLQKEFPALKKRYWGRHFWAIGYGAWSTGNMSEDLVNQYLEHHRDHPDNSSDGNFIVE